MRLRESESDEALFQRVRAATTEALFLDADREKREREKEFPAWAIAKKRAVEDALAEQRRREKGGENFPDGIVLVAERQAARPPPGEDAPASPNTVEVTRTSSEGAAPARVSKATVPLPTGGTEAPSYIYLQVWVERGSGKSYQRNTGTVPLPLRPDTNVGELVRYIRTLATHLRQYERPASGQPPAPADSLERTLPSKQALEAFPAVLAPTDLHEDGITVSGARNEFHMQLDYEYVYGGGPDKDLYIASKLFSQYIRFYWKVLRVPAAFKMPETEGARPIGRTASSTCTTRSTRPDSHIRTRAGRMPSASMPASIPYGVTTTPTRRCGSSSRKWMKPRISRKISSSTARPATSRSGTQS